MNSSIEVKNIVGNLAGLYGEAIPFGRSRLFQVGNALCCSINYSKLLRGDKYFFGLSQEVVSKNTAFPQTEHGVFVLLVCGSADQVLVLPRPLILRMLEGVETRRIDIFLDGGRFIMQTTRHPKLDVTQYLNSYPEPTSKRGDEAEPDTEDVDESPTARDHVAIQWALIRLGKAAGHSVWVPAGDRHLTYGSNSFVSSTLERLPHLGFDEGTRRVVQNIDVLWMNQSVILKAFEIESTTTIYSGLLRLNDLVLAQPNNRVDLYLAAGKKRRNHVAKQLLRPTFRPLLPRCQFLSFEGIQEQLGKLNSLQIEGDLKISGLIKGERFGIPDHVVYPSGLIERGRE